MFLESLGRQQFQGSMGGCFRLLGAVGAFENDSEPGEADSDPGMVGAPLAAVGFRRPAQHLDRTIVMPRHCLRNAEARLEAAEVDAIRPETGMLPVLDLLLIDAGGVLEAALAEVEIGETHGNELRAIGLLSGAPQFLAQNLNFELYTAVNDLFGVAPARLLNQDLSQTLQGEDHHSNVANLFIGGDGALILLFRLGIAALIHAQISPKRVPGGNSRMAAGETGPQTGQRLAERALGLAHFPQPVESMRKLHETVALIHRPGGLLEFRGDGEAHTAVALRLDPVPGVKSEAGPLCRGRPLVSEGTEAQQQEDGYGGAGDQQPNHDTQESDVPAWIFSGNGWPKGGVQPMNRDERIRRLPALTFRCGTTRQSRNCYWTGRNFCSNSWWENR